MSRQINLTKPLSDRDRAYLVQRARHHDLAIADGYAAESLGVVDDGNTGDIDPFKKDDGTDLMSGTHPKETPTTAAQAQQVEVTADPEKANEVVPGEPETPLPDRQAGDGLEDDEDDEEVEDEDDNYDDESVWSYRDLQGEIQSRNEGREDDDKMSASGDRAALIARLREDDQAE